VQDGYLRGGFADAAVTVKVERESDRALIEIIEGARYRAGDVTVIGAKTIPVDRLIQKLTQPSEAPGAGAAGAEIGHATYRHVHYAEDRLVIANQRDIDRKLAITLDEFLGAVERVDEPERVPGAARRIVDLGGRLLGHDRQLGVERRETFDDAMVCRHIGFSQWGLVILVLNRKLGFIDVEYFFAGFDA